MRKLDMSKYYYGKVCEKHPELNGLRSKSRWFCVGCQREASKAYMRRRYGKLYDRSYEGEVTK